MKNILYGFRDMLRQYAVCRGRLSRSGYWWAMAGVLIVDAALWSLGRGALLLSAVVGVDWLLRAACYALTLWNLFLFLPVACASIRRYHDIGRPGWQALLLGGGSLLLLGAGLVLGVFLLLAAAFSGGWLDAGALESRKLMGYIGAWLGMLGGGVVLGIWNLYFLLKPSEPGENRYGVPVPFPPEGGKDDGM